MGKVLTIVTAVSAVVLLVLYIIGAYSNADKVHDVHQGVEDRAIMQAENLALADADFIDSANKAATLVSKTIQPGREYFIDFELITSDGEYLVEEQRRLAWESSKDWRKYCEDAIIADLAKSEKIRAVYDAGETARITCTLLMCPVYADNGAGQCVLECSDSNNDGTWDTESVSI